jgi:hypothetical protein
MTSIVRNTASRTTLPSPAQFVLMTYEDSDGNDAPVPFRFDRTTGNIDIAFVNGFGPTTETSDRSKFYRAQTFGGRHLITGLSGNFKAWIEGEFDADPGTVDIHESGVVCSINASSLSLNPDDIATSEEKDFPISFESAYGSTATNYYQTLLFMKALVIKYKISGVPKWRAFFNNFEGNT